MVNPWCRLPHVLVAKPPLSASALITVTTEGDLFIIEE